MANEPKVTKLPIPQPTDTAIAAVEKATQVAASLAATSIPAAESAPDVAGKTIENSAAQGRKAMEKNMDQMTRSTEGFQKAAEDVVEFGRGNIEAFTKATQTYVSGMQDLSKQAFAVMQALNEQAVQNAKALATVKSLKEAAELQTSFAKAQLEKTINETTKLNEAAFKLAEQSSAPIAARVTLAMERITRPVSLA